MFTKTSSRSNLLSRWPEINERCLLLNMVHANFSVFLLNCPRLRKAAAEVVAFCFPTSTAGRATLALGFAAWGAWGRGRAWVPPPSLLLPLLPLRTWADSTPAFACVGRPV
jgi:hypothetical protein